MRLLHSGDNVGTITLPGHRESYEEVEIEVNGGGRGMRGDEGEGLSDQEAITQSSILVGRATVGDRQAIARPTSSRHRTQSTASGLRLAHETQLAYLCDRYAMENITLQWCYMCNMYVERPGTRCDAESSVTTPPW